MSSLNHMLKLGTVPGTVPKSLYVEHQEFSLPGRND